MLLIDEIQKNSWAYIPRVRYKSEVENCDVISHDENLYSNDNVNVMLNANVNETFMERVLIGQRKYSRPESYWVGDSFPRYRQLYVETRQYKGAEYKNSKNFYSTLNYSKEMLVVCQLRQVLKPCPCRIQTIWLDAPGKDTRRWIPISLLPP